MQKMSSMITNLIILILNALLINVLTLQSFHVAIGTGKEWRVVCYGSYSDIYVLDALSLEVCLSLILCKTLIYFYNVIMMNF